MSDRRDAGFATVLAAGLVVLLVLAGAGAAAVAVGARAHEHAAVAADAAALAAALAVAGGDPCRSAAELAAANGATVTRCAVVGADATVTVTAGPPPWLAWAGVARVKARAGPADAAEGANADEPARAPPPS